MAQTVKTLIKASIRNIDIHLMSSGYRRYQVTWCAKDANIKDVMQKQFDSVSYLFHPHNISFMERHTSALVAMRRFKKLVRTAQDPSITFEINAPKLSTRMTTVGVICLNETDFRKHVHLIDSTARFKPSKRAISEDNNILYKGFSSVVDTRSWSVDKIISSEHAMQNPEFSMILECLRSALNSYPKEPK